MPTTEHRVRHLLRRTEFVDRQSRVDELVGLEIESAVDNVLSTSPSSPISLGTSDETWHQGQSLAKGWLDQMASTARPMRERMAFFWHGHICSELGKVNSAPFMAEQIELFRSDGLTGNIGQLLKDMSLQVAMLRYLDNDRNFAESPNQNFARELMELFVLGVGNYVEADVEASTAAWTGHTAHWETGAYSFVIERHEYSIQTFLGKTINENSKPFADAGYQTIDVMLGLGDYSGGGTVPVGPNAGRSTREVAAEFLSKKLWQEFAEANSGGVPAGVLGDMVDALLDNDFDIEPWVRAMLVHDDFYPDTNPVVDGGLVRQPVEYTVALMVALGRTADQVAATWLMGQAGQALLYPPNVSGWKPNGYWVNASAMEARNQMALNCYWKIMDDYWKHGWEERNKNFIQLQSGHKIYGHEISGGQGLSAPYDIDPITNEVLVDRCIDGMDLHVEPETRAAFIAFCASLYDDVAKSGNQYERNRLPLLILLAPEMHIN